MKTISIIQPWAWLIANGYKDVENRNWKTGVRGEILIHAGKKFDDAGYEWVRQNFPNIPLPQKSEFARGGIVGKATIKACVTAWHSRWFSGVYGFVMENASPLPFRACAGRLGFFEVDYDGLL